MKKAFDDYVHLAGSNRGGCSLWEGPDHLLVIETMPFLGFTERYKRIDYTKIETISYGRTAGFWWTCVWQVLLLALLGWGIVSTIEDARPGAIVLGVIALVVAIALIVHLVRGPTCICRLQTAVQILKLKALNRVGVTTRVVTRLRELCLQHQGGQEASSADLLNAGTTAAAARDSVAGSLIKPPFTGSRIVTIALLLLLPAGAMTIGEPYINNFGYFFADCLCGLLAHTLAVIGLAMIFRYQTPTALKISLWGASVNLVLSFITGYALLIMASFKQVEAASRSSSGVRLGTGAEFSVWQWMSQASFQDLGWVAWLFVISGCIDILCGLIGLPSVLRSLGKTVVAAPPAAPPVLPSMAPVASELPMAPAANEHPPSDPQP